MEEETDREKVHIERAIERARDGVGVRIDELDRALRGSFDVKSTVREHAPQIVAGAAVFGFLVGFGFPKVLKRALQVGVPIGLIAWKLKQSKDADVSTGTYV